MYDATAYDLESRRKFRAADAGHLVFTFICLVCSGLLISRDFQCSEFKNWNRFMFYGNMIWLAYLLITLVTQFKNKQIRIFLSYLDWIIFLFHVGMSIWANIIYWPNRNGKTACVKRWEYWVWIYIVFGYIALTALVSVIFMFCLRETNHKRYKPKKESYNYDGDN